jgi:hypothetical protein
MAPEVFRRPQAQCVEWSDNNVAGDARQQQSIFIGECRKSGQECRLDRLGKLCAMVLRKGRPRA